jgi:hypothetical protein
VETFTLEQTSSYIRVRPRLSTQQEVLDYYVARMNSFHSLCALEHWQDLIFDLAMQTMDALLTAGLISFTAEEQANIATLRSRWEAQRSCTLQDASWQPGYIFDRKAEAMSIRNEYFLKKLEFGLPL